MRLLEFISSLAIPAVVVACGCIMLFGKKNYFSVFVEGAFEGVRVTVKLLPTLVALLAGMEMLKVSGALEVMSELLSPAADAVGIPEKILPLLLTRPFSGGASSAMLSTLLSEVDPDGLDALTAAVIMGSSDTAVYVISVYFSSVGVKKTAYALPLSLIIMLLCVFFSSFVCRACFN